MPFTALLCFATAFGAHTDQAIGNCWAKQEAISRMSLHYPASAGFDVLSLIVCHHRGLWMMCIPLLSQLQISISPPVSSRPSALLPPRRFHHICQDFFLPPHTACSLQSHINHLPAQSHHRHSSPTTDFLPENTKSPSSNPMNSPQAPYPSSRPPLAPTVKS
jgi:hypothetical protein